MHIGIAVMASGLVIVDVVLRSVGGGLTAWEMAAPLALTGFGMGMVFVPMFDVILAGVAPQQLGSAAGLLESVQQLAMSIGIAVVGTVLFDRLGTGHGPAAFVGAPNGLLVAVGLLGRRRSGVLAAPPGLPGDGEHRSRLRSTPLIS